MRRPSSRSFQLQRRYSAIPREGVMVIECFREEAQAGTRRQALSHYFFHTLIGRGANDALSRIIASRVARLVGGNAIATSDDYGFLLTLRRSQEIPLEKWRECFVRAGAEDDLRAALRDSELIRWQFRAVAQTGLMVPRQFPGRDRKIRQLRFSSEILFRVLEEHEPDHPMLAETYRHALTGFLDVEAACAWMGRAAESGWNWRLMELSAVSPFGFGLYVNKFKESMMFEDINDAIERMYRQFYEQAGG